MTDMDQSMTTRTALMGWYSSKDMNEVGREPREHPWKEGIFHARQQLPGS
jgi:hypothetical protein